jgi:hypothetical protein
VKSDSRKSEELVDFVRDNRKLVAFSDLQDVEDVFSAEDVAARVARIVDENRASFLVDQAFHVIEVNVPVVRWI